MPAADPLAVLARLRRLETQQARRILAERLARCAAADARAEAAAAAIAREAAVGQSDAFGAWVVRGLAERSRTAHLAEGAAREVQAARAVLGAARAAERVVERLAEERRRVAGRAAARAEQVALDDRGAAARGRA